MRLLSWFAAFRMLVLTWSPHLVLRRGDHRRRLRVSRAQVSAAPGRRRDDRSGRCRWCCRPCSWFGRGFHLPQACNGNIVPSWTAGDIIFVTWRVREPHVNLKEVFFGNVYMFQSCYASSSPVGLLPIEAWIASPYIERKHQQTLERMELLALRQEPTIASEVDQIQEPSIWSCWHLWQETTRPSEQATSMALAFCSG